MDRVFGQAGRDEIEQDIQAAVATTAKPVS